MKGVYIEPGSKSGQIVVPLPDCIIQYLGWKEGDYVEIEIRSIASSECLVVTRRTPPVRQGY